MSYDPDKETSSAPSVVSVVIVNWNGLKHLEPCLASLRRCPERVEIIVVDNNSTDGSPEYLRRQADVRLIPQERNIGYAEANNVGIAAAGGSFVLLLNNDTRVAPDFLRPLLELFANDSRVGAIQCKIVTFDNPPRVDALGSYLTWTGFLYHYRYGGIDEKAGEPFEIFCAKGAAMVIRREVLVAAGAFDPDFFAYLEDSDLSWRIWLAGWTIRCVPQSVVMHKGAATASRLAKEFVLFHSNKNRLAMLIKNLSAGRLAAVLPVHVAMNLALGGFYLATGDMSSVRAIGRGLWWNLRNLTKTLHKRRYVQRSVRNVSDSALWPRITRKVRPSYYYYALVDLGRYRE